MLEETWRERVEAAMQVARRAVNRVHEVVNTRTAPFAGEIEDAAEKEVAQAKAKAAKAKVVAKKPEKSDTKVKPVQ